MTDANGPNSFRRRARKIAESFLQTAVILDDFAEMPSPERAQPRQIRSRITNGPDYRELPDTEDLRTRRDPRDAPLDARAVIDGFAEIGSTCAVLRPSPDEEYHEKTIKVAARADIVILDWKIHDSTGEEALSLLKDILTSDQNNCRLRLLAIYTGEPNLQQVSDQVQKAISEFYTGEQIDAEDPYRISKGPLRIVILAKAGFRADTSPATGQETAELDLATRLVDEFALMTEGLLRNVALAGISAIRQQSHRLLTKFDRHLDPAYLGHRQMLSNPNDAEDHLAEALAAEIFSVLSDERPGEQANADAIRDWLTSMQAAGLDLSTPFAFPKTTKPVDGWHQLTSQGAGSKHVTRPNQVGIKKLGKIGTRAFVDTPDQALQSDRSFAALLSLKSQYAIRAPRLALGTILRETTGGFRYLLCLQPKCDSIRLTAATGFPLIPLEENNDTFRLAIEVTAGLWKHFNIVLKPSGLIARSFQPRNKSDGEIFAISEGDKMQFQDIDGHTYHWIGEMKDEYALMLAGDVASSLARPGPNNSEWLRRASQQ